jgi:hypothetical protein
MLYTNDNDIECSKPIFFLTFNALTVGTILNWSLISPSLHPNLPLPWKLIPLILISLAIILTWTIQTYRSQQNSNLISYNIIHLNITSIWQITPISSQHVAKSFMVAANTTTKLNDHGWLEFIGPQGIFNQITKPSKTLLSLKSLPLTSFFISIFITLIIIIIILY